MPLVDFNIRVLGDLVVREFSPADGYCREEVTVPAGTYPMGTLVVGNADLTGSFPKYVAGAAVPAGSILAIVIGDHFDVRETFTKTAASQALVLHRGPLQVSDFLVRQVNGLNDAQAATVTNALNVQGIDLLKAR